MSTLHFNLFQLKNYFAQKKFKALIAIGIFAAVAPQLAYTADLEAIKKRGTIRIAVANEIPYGYMNINGEAKGAGPDVAKHIAKELGIAKIEWIPTSFSALIPGLKANRFDMVAAEMAILPQRCLQVSFSNPNSSYGEGLLVAAGNPHDLHRYEDFLESDKKVAIMAGADQLEMLQTLGVPAERMITIANNADAISTVSTGRASAYAATSLSVSELAGKSDRVEPAKKFSDPIINGEPARSWGGFTFSKNSENLRNAVNEKLAEFKRTDEWKKILNQYGFSTTDTEASFNKSAQELCAG